MNEHAAQAAEQLFVWFCERGAKCKWQCFALHKGLAWGCAPENYGDNSWRAWHDKECGGKLTTINLLVIDAATADLRSIIPATFYADRPLAERLKLLVEQWDAAGNVIDILELSEADLIAKLAAAERLANEKHQALAALVRAVKTSGRLVGYNSAPLDAAEAALTQKG